MNWCYVIRAQELNKQERECKKTQVRPVKQVKQLTERKTKAGNARRGNKRRMTGIAVNRKMVHWHVNITTKLSVL